MSVPWAGQSSSFLWPSGLTVLARAFFPTDMVTESARHFGQNITHPEDDSPNFPEERQEEEKGHDVSAEDDGGNG